MALSTENLLAIRQAIAQKVELCDLTCLPSAVYFESAADFWAWEKGTKVTQKDIELTLITAVWIRFLRFEDVASRPNAEAGEDDSPITIRFYELTLFRSISRASFDESDHPDAFKKRLLKTDIEIESNIENLNREFRGIQAITSLSDEIFAVGETNSLSQEGAVEYDTTCEFIKNVTGNQVNLICPIKIQLRSC